MNRLVIIGNGFDLAHGLPTSYCDFIEDYWKGVIRSIKVFYYKKENGADNYTEIIQNISRHFNDKKLMRSKIVNKTLCQPLPQIQLPKKQNDPQS